MKKIRILHLDEDFSFCQLLRSQLPIFTDNITIHSVTCPKKALSYLAENLNDVDVIISDYKMADIIGFDLKALIQRESKDIPFIILTGSSHSFELKNGALQLGKYSLSKIGKPGKVFSDISNAINLANQNTIHRLQEKIAEKELFMDILLHDLTSFLLPANGFLEVSLNQERHHDMILQRAKSCIIQATKLVNSVSITCNHLSDQDLYLLNLNQIIREAVNIVKEIFPNRLINIEIGKMDENITVLADSLLQELLLNLLTNAVKNDLHKIVCVFIGVEKRLDNTLVITVTDHGKGIPIELRETIFKGSKRCQSDYPFVCIGLKIVKRLVERYGGKIWIKSRVADDFRKGTSIIVSLTTKNPDQKIERVVIEKVQGRTLLQSKESFQTNNSMKTSNKQN